MTKKKSAHLYTPLILMAACLLFFSSTFAYADTEDIEQIRNAIKAKGAKWHADKTSVSGLSWEEKKLRLGISDDKESLTADLPTEKAAGFFVGEGVPATFDWRNLEGVSYVSPVKNQGSCGSCWAFATTAALESQVMIAATGMPIDLSEQILVSCSNCGTCSGGSSACASSFIRDVGLPLESCFKYTATNADCSNACQYWENDTYRIVGWHSARTATTITAADMRDALFAYGPVVATMYVYSDFYSYRSGVYSYVTGSYVGAHAVLVVGYDDVQQAFIVKNSWGSGWGESGYFMIAYSELGGTSKFAYSTMVYEGMGDNPPPPEPPVVPCTYSLSSTSATFKAAGGSGNFSLYAEGSCLTVPTAVSSASWVTITGTALGGAGATIYYAVAPNTGPARSATIDVAGLSFTIKQLKGSPAPPKKK